MIPTVIPGLALETARADTTDRLREAAGRHAGRAVQEHARAARIEARTARNTATLVARTAGGSAAVPRTSPQFLEDRIPAVPRHRHWRLRAFGRVVM